MNQNDLYQFWGRIYKSIDWRLYDDCKRDFKLGSDCKDCASRQYFSGNSIDYSCAQLRKIYVLRYLHVHWAEVFDALNLTRSLNEFPDMRKNLNILSLGGGPGSDILAFKSFAIHGLLDKNKITFNITRLDCEATWNDLAVEVIDLCKSDNKDFFKHRRINTTISDFAKVDVLKERYSVFLISYLISELEGSEIDDLISIINTRKADNSIVIINDRNEELVDGKIAKLINGLNIKREIRNAAVCFCGVIYPNEFLSEMKPKRNMKSLRLGLLVE